MLFYVYLFYIIPSSIIIPVFIALQNFKLLDKPLLIIFCFTCFSAIVNVITILMSFHHMPNLPVYHIYAVFEFAFILGFYSYQFKGIARNVIVPLIALFAIACGVNFVFVQKGIEFNTYTRPIEAIIIVLYAVLFLSKQDQLDANYAWKNQSLNWINAGLLIYYSCSFFTFIFSNYLLGLGKLANEIVWGFYGAILILENILFAIGFYKCRKQPIISSY